MGVHVVWRGRIPLPEKCPPCLDEGFWTEYRKSCEDNLRLKYERSAKNHRVQKIFTFDGLLKLNTVSEHARGSLSRLLIHSMPKWNNFGEYRRIEVKPHPSGDYASGYWESPLWYWLRSRPWLAVREHDKFAFFRPKDRWFFPSAIKGHHSQCRHMDLIPPETALLIELNELRSILASLGMPVYDPDSETDHSPRLLEDLAEALEKGREIVNPYFFLFQVREAWKRFTPGEGDEFPRKLVVSDGDSSMKSVVPTEDAPVYLKDVEDAHLALKTDFVAEIPSSAIRRLRDGLIAKYGKGLRFISERRQEIRVDGPIGERAPIADSPLKWIICPLLSLHAYYGATARGANTSTFQETAQLLRSCSFLECAEIKVEVKMGEEVLRSALLEAFWNDNAKTIVVTSRYRTDLAVLSDSLGKLLGRDDLGIALKLVLGRISGQFDGQNDDVAEPSEDEVLRALREVSVDHRQFENVKLLWLGDVASRVRLLRPALDILKPGSDLSHMDSITSESALVDFISGLELEHGLVREILDLSARSNSAHHFGESLFKSRGAIFELGNWNSSLGKFGLPRVLNESAAEDFQNYQNEAILPLYWILCRIASVESHSFKEMRTNMEARCPDDLQYAFWKVDFKTTMREIATRLKDLGANENELELVCKSDNAAQLSSGLIASGLPQIDPIQVQKENTERCAAILEKIQAVTFVWYQRRKSVPWGLALDTPALIQKAGGLLGNDGFIAALDDAGCFALVRERLEVAADLKDKLKSASDVHDFMAKAGCSISDIANIVDLRSRAKEEEQRKRNTISIAGDGFDTREINMLFSHMKSRVDPSTIGDLNPAKPASLGPPPVIREPSREPGRKGGTGGGGWTGFTGAQDHLIGFAGEIHAFIKLHQQYGSGLIHPGCWKSEFSLMAYPENTAADDRCGYDLEFTHEGITYQVEVKSSVKSEPLFYLGPTEVRAARRAARKPGVRYLILRITEALSKSPKMYFLPNPYDRRFRDRYSKKESNFLVCYNVE
jgi:hypothetical protein